MHPGYENLVSPERAKYLNMDYALSGLYNKVLFLFDGLHPSLVYYAQFGAVLKTSNLTERDKQFDLLIDRQDNCINVCEMKFAVNEFEITKKTARTIQGSSRMK